MEIKYIIIILLVLVNFYLLFKTTKINNKISESFNQSDIIKKTINDVYKADLNQIRNLANLGKQITGNSSITMPSNTNTNNYVTTSSDFDNISVLDLTSINEFTINNINILPIGTIITYYNSTNFNSVPSGWVICDGQNGTPDLTNRFVLGQGTSSTTNNTSIYGSNAYDSNIHFNIGDTGGSTTHLITQEEMAHHHHGIIGEQGGSSDGSGYGLIGSDYTAEFTDANNFTDAIEHENMPPYHVLRYIMKIK